MGWFDGDAVGDAFFGAKTLKGFIEDDGLAEEEGCVAFAGCLLPFAFETDQHPPAVGQRFDDGLKLPGLDGWHLEELLEFDIHGARSAIANGNVNSIFVLTNPLSPINPHRMDVHLIIKDVKLAAEIETISAKEFRDKTKTIIMLLTEAIAARKKKK